MSQGSKTPVLVVGSMAFDSIQTPTESVEMALGGSATFGAIAASYFAAPRVVGIVGDDFTDEHLAVFTNRGIDTAGIDRVSGKTFHWKGSYHKNMQDRDTLDTQLNVFETFDPELPESYRDSKFVFLGNIAPQIQMKVLDQVEAPTFVGLDTMNFWISSTLGDLKAVLRRIDLLFINDEEAFELSNERQVIVAGERILKMGPKYVVIKRGEFGSLLFGKDICFFVPAVLLPRVVDPTGAGDAFAGGFVGSVARAGKVSRSVLAEGMLYGTVLASFAVEQFSVAGVLELERATIDLRREFIESMTDYS